MSQIKRTISTVVGEDHYEQVVEHEIIYNSVSDTIKFK